MTSCVALCAAAAVSTWAVAPAAAQDDYPNQPITLVVAFSPGGSTDTIARIFYNDLSQALGQPVVVENRPGAGGFVAWRSIVSAEPDGYTVLLAENALAINTALRGLAEGFDPRESFEPIGRVAFAGTGVVVNREMWEDEGVDTLEKLVDYSQENEINFSSSGVGSVSHMTFEAMAAMTGVRAEHIPYGGGGESTAALVGNHVQAMNTGLGHVVRLVNESNAKALAVNSSERIESLPDVPTMAELGYESDVELRFWWGLFVPAGTPDAVKEKLETALEEVLSNDDVVQRMANAEYDADFGTAEEFGDALDREITAWQELVADLGIEAN